MEEALWFELGSRASGLQGKDTKRLEGCVSCFLALLDRHGSWQRRVPFECPSAGGQRDVFSAPAAWVLPWLPVNSS